MPAPTGTLQVTSASAFQGPKCKRDPSATTPCSAFSLFFLGVFLCCRCPIGPTTHSECVDVETSTCCPILSIMLFDYDSDPFGLNTYCRFDCLRDRFNQGTLLVDGSPPSDMNRNDWHSVHLDSSFFYVLPNVAFSRPGALACPPSPSPCHAHVNHRADMQACPGTATTPC